MSMRSALFLLIAVLMLVSHGGFTGAVPHADHAHGHAHVQDAGHGHVHDDEVHEASVAIALVEGAEAALSSSDVSGETQSSHSVPHGHAVLGMPESGTELAAVSHERLLPSPLPATALVGTGSAPLTQPPSA